MSCFISCCSGHWFGSCYVEIWSWLVVPVELEAWTSPAATANLFGIYSSLTETLEVGGNLVCLLLLSVCLFARPLWPISGAYYDRLCMCRGFVTLQSIETTYWKFGSEVLGLLLGRVCLATVRITRGKLLRLSCTVRYQEPTTCGAVDRSTVE